MYECYAQFGFWVASHLIAEPITHIVGQIGAGEVGHIRTALPIILHREYQEEYIAIHERIGDAIKLRFCLGILLKGVVGVEVEGVVEVARVVMVTIGRYDRHLLDDRGHGFFKPTLPFPFRITCASCFYKVAWEYTELSLWYILDNCGGSLTDIIDILLVLDMRVGHIHECELLGFVCFVLGCGSESVNIAPIAICTYAVCV